MIVGNIMETIMVFKDRLVEDFEVQVLKIEMHLMIHAKFTLVDLVVM